MADSIDVIEMFKQAAFEVDNRRLPELKADTVIATLGMDSVAVMELVSYFEEKLRVRMPKRTKARRPSALSMSASASRHTYTAPSSTKYARPEGAPAAVSARTIAAAQSATYTTLSVFLPPPVIGSTPLRTEVKNASVSRSRGP